MFMTIRRQQVFGGPRVQGLPGFPQGCFHIRECRPGRCGEGLRLGTIHGLRRAESLKRWPRISWRQTVLGTIERRA
jgi:hypothetical protein